MIDGPDNSPNVLRPQMRRGAGVRRLNRIPLIIAAIMLLLIGAAVVYTYQMRLADMRRRAAEAEPKPEPANISELFSGAPSSGLIEAVRPERPAPAAPAPQPPAPVEPRPLAPSRSSQNGTKPGRRSAGARKSLPLSAPTASARQSRRQPNWPAAQRDGAGRERHVGPGGATGGVRPVERAVPRRSCPTAAADRRGEWRGRHQPRGGKARLSH